jgi:hypothetical protein
MQEQEVASHLRVFANNQKHYDFDCINPNPSIHAKTLMLAFVGQNIEVYELIGEDRTKAANQLQAYLKLTNAGARWIMFVDASGFRNPTTNYSGCDPALYLSQTV